jgi:hypothetical protein
MPMWVLAHTAQYQVDIGDLSAGVSKTDHKAEYSHLVPGIRLRGEFYLRGYNAAYSAESQPTFRKNITSSSRPMFATKRRGT